MKMRSPWFIVVLFDLSAPFYAAAASVASTGAGTVASCAACGTAWRNGSYASPLAHRLWSNTASFRATATTARFLAFFPPRSLSRSP